jgi:hypothetical protein
MAMSSRFFAFAAIASVLLLGVVAAIAAGTRTAYAQADDKWYLGEGVKENMYVKYKIQEIGTDRVPFIMTIYFKEQDNNKNWVAPTYIEVQGQVYNGTLKLADSNLTPLGGGQVPSEMVKYVSSYQSSVTFLEAYAPKSSPKSLSQISWGNVAGTGASPIAPAGKEKVTVQGGTFDTTIISYSRGSTVNKIWVADNFPFPIKALVYAEVTSPPAPVRYQFELLEHGEGQPPAPTSQEEIPTPPIRRSTPTENYQIELDWNCADCSQKTSMEPGKDVQFSISFFDNKGFPTQRVSYDFTVKDTGGQTILEKKNQIADSGLGFQTVKFDQGGGRVITVKIDAVSGVPNDQFIETADFNVVVVPEFPVSAAILAAAVIGMVVAVTRFRGTSLGSMFGGKNAL